MLPVLDIVCDSNSDVMIFQNSEGVVQKAVSSSSMEFEPLFFPELSCLMNRLCTSTITTSDVFGTLEK